MAIATRSAFGALVNEDAVHRRLYTDSNIFAEEMRRIFGRTWVFIGHESEVPNPGDFKTGDLAGQPTIMVRHANGEIHVLFNRCRHRGAMVCAHATGNASYFQCPYHAWVYKTNGDLALVPNVELFGSDFQLADWGLVHVPRVDSYGGFVFASLSPEGISLDEHLGRAKHYIDVMVGRAPFGAIQATQALRYEYPGNWKFQIENMSDNYHATYVHASAFGVRADMGQNGAAHVFGNAPNNQEQARIERSFGHGHGVLDYQGTRLLVTEPDRYPAYFAALRERRGEARARELARTDLHVMIYPNLILHTNYNHYRVIRPLAVDHTEINTYPCRLVGAPDEVNEALVAASALHVSPAGRVQVDDLEAFSRVQRGLAVEAAEWVLFKMRGVDEHVNEYGELECRFLSEMIPRGYYREWLRLMSQE
ncbi:MAG: Rieske 2Fe-2S domain-containing protein [Chloroflexi bacterium]|nr:Rieske 2Fe-2S domain-containing protein [Chloroflexota bacterium]